MKINEMAFATAHAALAFFAFILCVVMVAVLPGSTMWLFDSWFHGISLSELPIQTGPTSMVGLGLVTFTTAAWLWGFLLAKVYNIIAK